MIRRLEERKKVEMVNAQGGLNSIFAHLILEGDEFIGAGRLFNIVTFPPNSSIGYHVHNGESETYLILQGRGMYDDNGEKFEVGPGDVAYCAPGQGHELVNITDEDLVVAALIIFDKTK